MVIDSRVRLPQELRPPEFLPAEYRSQYDAVLDLSAKKKSTFQDLKTDMDEAGIVHAVLHAEYEHGDPADELNTTVAGLVSQDPNRFSGFGTISMAPPFSIGRAQKQLGWIADAGLHGLSIQPSFFGMAIDDRRLYPIYGKASECNLVVAIHTGINYTTSCPIKNESPLQVDQVACDFPHLTLIACHAGWPWTVEMTAIMRKHPKVYAEFGGLAPKYVLSGDTGWGVMHTFMNSLLYEQVLFGTDWPVFPMQRAVEEWNAGALKPHVLAALMHDNAARLLRRTHDTL